MRPNESSTSPAHERQRLERICAALLAAFEAHPETRDTDLCAFKLDNQHGVVIDDYDDPRRAVDGQTRGGALCGWRSFQLRARRRSRGDPPRGWTTTALEVRSGGCARLWPSVHTLPPEARTRRRRPTTKLHAVPTVELLEYESDD
jgi:hypothetical protein